MNRRDALTLLGGAIASVAIGGAAEADEEPQSYERSERTSLLFRSVPSVRPYPKGTVLLYEASPWILHVAFEVLAGGGWGHIAVADGSGFGLGAVVNQGVTMALPDVWPGVRMVAMPYRYDADQLFASMYAHLGDPYKKSLYVADSVWGSFGRLPFLRAQIRAYYNDPKHYRWDCSTLVAWAVLNDPSAPDSVKKALGSRPLGVTTPEHVARALGMPLN